MTITNNATSNSSRNYPVIRHDVFVLSLGLALMYSPTLYVLLGSNDAALWQKGEHSHGPIMLTIALWLLHKRWREFSLTQAPSNSEDGHPNTQPPGQIYAWFAMALGISFYVTGRALGIIYIEVASFIPMVASVVLLAGGTKLAKTLTFPLFFLIFIVPLPGFIVDPISQTIKLYVSTITSNILWHFEYPITHTGVIINIGQYQLLVADACAGMRTLFMLEAMGIFYINVIRHSSMLRNICLATLIVPISFTANCIRVIFLALLTYHFGDEVGQGFLHGFAGIVLFIIALILIITLDHALRLVDAKILPNRAT